MMFSYSCCATALGEVLSYSFDARSSRQALGRLFERVHAALKPGGLFVFDVAIVGRNSNFGQHFSEGDDWTVLVEFEHDAKRIRLTRRIVSFRRVGKTYRRREETHRLQLFDRREIATRLREAGFRVRTLRGYGKSRLPDGPVGFLARKP